ncbi:hypothetical protein pb186bvf_020741 [Paramecium bursaria]
MQQKSSRASSNRYDSTRRKRSFQNEEVVDDLLDKYSSHVEKYQSLLQRLDTKHNLSMSRGSESACVKCKQLNEENHHLIQQNKLLYKQIQYVQDQLYNYQTKEIQILRTEMKKSLDNIAKEHQRQVSINSINFFDDRSDSIQQGNKTFEFPGGSNYLNVPKSKPLNRVKSVAQESDSNNLQNINQELEKTILQYKVLVNEEQINKKELKLSSDQQQLQIKTLNEKLEQFQDLIQGKDQKLISIVKRKEEYKNQLLKLSSDMKDQQQLVASKDNLIEELNQQINNYKKVIKQLQLQIQKSSKTIAESYYEQLSSKKKDQQPISDLDRIKQLEEDLEKIRQKNLKLQEYIKDKDLEIYNQNDLIHQLQQQINQQTQIRQQMSAEKQLNDSENFDMPIQFTDQIKTSKNDAKIIQQYEIKLKDKDLLIAQLVNVTQEKQKELEESKLQYQNELFQIKQYAKELQQEVLSKEESRQSSKQDSANSSKQNQSIISVDSPNQQQQKLNLRSMSQQIQNKLQEFNINYLNNKEFYNAFSKNKVFKLITHIYDQQRKMWSQLNSYQENIFTNAQNHHQKDNQSLIEQQKKYIDELQEKIQLQTSQLQDKGEKIDLLQKISDDLIKKMQILDQNHEERVQSLKIQFTQSQKLDPNIIKVPKQQYEEDQRKLKDYQEQFESIQQKLLETKLSEQQERVTSQDDVIQKILEKDTIIQALEEEINNLGKAYEDECMKCLNKQNEIISLNSQIEKVHLKNQDLEHQLQKVKLEIQNNDKDNRLDNKDLENNNNQNQIQQFELEQLQSKICEQRMIIKDLIFQLFKFNYIHKIQKKQLIEYQDIKEQQHDQEAEHEIRKIDTQQKFTMTEMIEPKQSFQIQQGSQDNQSIIEQLTKQLYDSQQSNILNTQLLNHYDEERIINQNTILKLQTQIKVQENQLTQIEESKLQGQSYESKMVKQQSQQISELENQIQILQTKIQKISEKEQLSFQELKDKDLKLQNQQEQLKDSKLNINLLENQLNDIQNQLIRQKQKDSQYNQQLVQQEQNEQSLLGQNKNLQIQLNQALQQLEIQKTDQEFINRLKSQKEQQLREQINSLQDEQNKVEADLQKMTIQNQKQQQQLSVYEQQIQILDQTNQIQTEQLKKSLNHQIKVLENQENQIYLENEELKVLIDQLKHQLNQYKSASIESEQKYIQKQLRKNLQLQISLSQDYTSQLQLLKKDKESLQIIIQKLQQQLDAKSLQSQNNLLEDDFVTYKFKISEQQNQATIKELENNEKDDDDLQAEFIDDNEQDEQQSQQIIDNKRNIRKQSEEILPQRPQNKNLQYFSQQFDVQPQINQGRAANNKNCQIQKTDIVQLSFYKYEMKIPPPKLTLIYSQGLSYDDLIKPLLEPYIAYKSQNEYEKQKENPNTNLVQFKQEDEREEYQTNPQDLKKNEFIKEDLNETQKIDEKEDWLGKGPQTNSLIQINKERLQIKKMQEENKKGNEENEENEENKKNVANLKQIIEEQQNQIDDLKEQLLNPATESINKKKELYQIDPDSNKTADLKKIIQQLNSKIHDLEDQITQQLLKS